MLLSRVTARTAGGSFSPDSPSSIPDSRGGSGTALLQIGYQAGGALTVVGLAMLLTNAVPPRLRLISRVRAQPGPWAGEPVRESTRARLRCAKSG